MINNYQRLDKQRQSLLENEKNSGIFMSKIVG